MISPQLPQAENVSDYLDDLLITAKIKAAVVRDLHLKSHEMQIATFQGKVQLSGFVSSYSHIDQTVSLARKVSGVRAVSSIMQLKQPASATAHRAGRANGPS